MHTAAPGQIEQIRLAMQALQRVLADALLGVYLYGSATSGGLRPHSDIDLLVVVGQRISDGQKNRLLSAFLNISGRHPAVAGGPRCIDVAAIQLAELSSTSIPMLAQFTYGEWLRSEFERGMQPKPVRDPEHTLIVAQAREAGRALFGPRASKLLPEITLNQLRAAMREALPKVLEGLPGDERNVLLTLARMWRTAISGEFVPKDVAAEWAVKQLSGTGAATLEHARRAYRGEIEDDWASKGEEARQLAARLHHCVISVL